MSALVPYILEKTDKGERGMDLYSRMLEDRVVFLNGEVNNDSAGVVLAQLLYLEAKAPDKDISLYINSPGGSISDGLAVVDTMNHVSCKVNTICVGLAASMGAVILASGEKGGRFILPNSEVLIHQPIIPGGLGGQCTDIRIHSDHMIHLRDKLEAILSEVTGQSLETIHTDCDRDHYMTAEEAVKYGLCDKII